MALRFNYQRAKAAGLSDQQIQQMVAAGPPVARGVVTDAEVPEEDTGFKLSSLLPIGGSLLGGLLGTPLGLPGIIGGSALGGGLGKGAEQVIEKQPIDQGEIGKEALFSGGGALIGGKILAPILGKLAGGASRAATIASKSTILGAKGQEALIKTVAKYPQLSGRSGFVKHLKVDSVIDDITNQVDDLLEGATGTVPKAAFQAKAGEIASTMDPNDARHFLRLFNKAVGKAPEQLGAKDVNNIKRVWNSQASAAFRSVEKGGVLSAPNQAILELRDLGDDTLTQLAPTVTKAGVDALNTDAKILIEGIPEFQKLSEQSLNIAGLPLPGVPRFGQALAGLTGKGLSKAAEPNTLARIGASVGASGGLSRPQTLPDQMPEEAIEGEILPETEQAGGGRSELQTLALLDVLAGKGKNSAKLLALDKAINPPPTEAQKGQVAQIQSAEGLIDSLESNFEIARKSGQTGFGVGPLSGFLGGVSGGGVAENAYVYNELRRGFTALIARATGERGVLTDADAERALRLLPSLNDTPSAAQRKLSEVRTIFRNAKAKIGASSGENGLDLESLLSL